MEEKFYIGSTEQTFKKRYPKHKESINNKSSKSATTLSTYIWSLKDKGEDPQIKWEVLKNANRMHVVHGAAMYCMSIREVVYFECRRRMHQPKYWVDAEMQAFK